MVTFVFPLSECYTEGFGPPEMAVEEARHWVGVKWSWIENFSDSLSFEAGDISSMGFI